MCVFVAREAVGRENEREREGARASFECVSMYVRALRRACTARWRHGDDRPLSGNRAGPTDVRASDGEAVP